VDKWWCGGSCCPWLPYLVLNHPRLPYRPKHQIIPGAWWWFGGGGGGAVMVLIGALAYLIWYSVALGGCGSVFLCADFNATLWLC
jgi:hypothetical protein